MLPARALLPLLRHRRVIPMAFNACSTRSMSESTPEPPKPPKKGWKKAFSILQPPDEEDTRARKEKQEILMERMRRSVFYDAKQSTTEKVCAPPVYNQCVSPQFCSGYHMKCSFFNRYLPQSCHLSSQCGSVAPMLFVGSHSAVSPACTARGTLTLNASAVSVQLLIADARPLMGSDAFDVPVADLTAVPVVGPSTAPRPLSDLFNGGCHTAADCRAQYAPI